MLLDISLIYQQGTSALYQGSRPPGGDFLAQAGFHVLALCADDYQPPAELFPGVQVLHVPMVDEFWAPPSEEMLRSAASAAKQLALALAKGHKVLSTCYAGWNRSGLLSAMTLHLWLGWSGAQAITQVKAFRRRALNNPQFTRCLQRLSPRRPLY